MYTARVRWGACGAQANERDGGAKSVCKPPNAVLIISEAALLHTGLCRNSFSSVLELIHCLRECASPFINKNVAAVKDLSSALSFDCAKLMRVKIKFIIKRTRRRAPSARANGTLTPCVRDNIYSGNYLYGEHPAAALIGDPINFVGARRHKVYF
jgi:hypothetical protein